jgi:hypothetical protein
MAKRRTAMKQLIHISSPEICILIKPTSDTAVRILCTFPKAGYRIFIDETLDSMDAIHSEL